MEASQGTIAPRPASVIPAASRDRLTSAPKKCAGEAPGSSSFIAGIDASPFFRRFSGQRQVLRAHGGCCGNGPDRFLRYCRPGTLGSEIISPRAPLRNAPMPTEPVTVTTGQEMDLPYPSDALGVSFLTLAAVPAAVGSSRELARSALERWGLAPLVADAELVVSELATNAVKAANATEARRDTETADRGRGRETSRPCRSGCCCSRPAS